MGLDVLDREGIVLDNVEIILDSRSDNWKHPIIRKHGHMFVNWNEEEVCYTKAELQKLHLHLFHPNVTKLYNIIKRVRPDDATPETKSVLEEIADACTNCHEHRNRPYRFRVSMPSDVVRFNYEVAVDLMWLQGNPLLHIVETHTDYQNAVLFKGKSWQDIWNAIVEGWASVYLGYPNPIRADSGSAFPSKFWKGVTTLQGNNVEISWVESHSSLGVGERSHDPLRQILDKIVSDHPRLDPEIAIRLAVKAINDTMGPEGVVPSLLVYGSLLIFPALNMDAPEQRTRMSALHVARR